MIKAEDHSQTKGGSNISVVSGTTCRIMACEVHDFDSVDSTNAKAIELAKEGAREGTVVLARTQTGGRGRIGRNWISPEGGLYLSVILRPRMDPSRISVIPLMAGLAVSKAISTSTGVVSSVKWPNDVLIGERKVCGILSECAFMGEDLEYVVLGIGINVNTPLDSFPEELKGTITTLAIETGHHVDMGEVARDLMYALDMLYGRLMEGQVESILDEWTGRSSTVGSDVVVMTSNGPIEGKALGVDGSGALILKQGSRLTRVDHGDCVTMR